MIVTTLAEPALRPGMSAQVEIDTGRERARYSRFFGAAAPDAAMAASR